MAREQSVVREVKRVKELIQQYKDRLGHTTTFYTQQARGLSLMHYEAMHQLVMEVSLVVMVVWAYIQGPICLYSPGSRGFVNGPS